MLEPVRMLPPHIHPLDRELPAQRPQSRQFEGRFVTVQPLDYLRDAEPLYGASHGADGYDRIWDYLPYGPFPDIKAFRTHLRAFNAGADPYFYAIRPHDAEGALGVASLMSIEPLHGSIEIGHIMLGIPLQKTPAATEALFLLMRHAMDDLGNRRLEWKCDASNQASRSAARRFGFAFEGMFYQHRVVKGRNRDTAWYSILDSEWPAVRDCFERWLNPDNFDSEGRQRLALRDLTSALREHREPGI